MKKILFTKKIIILSIFLFSIFSPTFSQDENTETSNDLYPIKQNSNNLLNKDSKTDITEDDKDIYAVNLSNTIQKETTEESITNGLLIQEETAEEHVKNTKKNIHSFFKIFKHNQEKKGEEFSENKIEKSRRLSKIEKIISEDEYLNHKNAVNDIYLDKYQRTYSHTEDDFYKSKNLIKDETGLVNVIIDNEERTIDKILDEIENSDSSNLFAPPIKLSLKECIGIALIKHPNILSAKLSKDISKERIIQAWASYFPSFSIGTDYNKYRSKTNGYEYKYSSNYIPTVSAGLLLFDFGKTKTYVDIAKTDYEANIYNFESSINDIIYSVKSAYYSLLFAQLQIEVYKNTIEDFELQLKMAKKYFEIGKKPQIDVMIAEFNTGNAKLNLVKAINTLEVARVNFANTLGLPGFINFELSEDLPVFEYDVDLEVLLHDAFTIRPDILIQEKMVENAYLNIRSAVRNYTPDLTANASYAKGKSDSIDLSNGQIGLNLSYSGLNLLQIKKEHDIAKLAYKKALADYENIKQQVYMDVKGAYINLNSTKNTVKQAILNVEQAKTQNYHATGRYNAGYGDAIELKDAENTYLSAQLEYYQALLNYNLEAASIERLVGRPLENTNEEL